MKVVRRSPLKAIFLVLLFSASALADEPQGVILDMGTIKWGVSQAEARRFFREKYDLCRNSITEPNIAYCGLSHGGVDLGDGHRYTELYFYRNRFFKYEVRFTSDVFTFVADALEKRLGEPTEKREYAVQNRMGATFDQVEKEWNMETTKVWIVKRRSDQPNGGRFVVTYLPIAKEVEVKVPHKAPF